MMAYMDYGSRPHLHLGQLLKWIDAYKKQTNTNRWRNESPRWSRSTPIRNSSKRLQTHNAPTYDVEKIMGTNKRRDLRVANK